MSYRYSASRGGHAPGHLREALLFALDAQPWAAEWWDALDDEDALVFGNPVQQVRWNGLSTKTRARWLTGQLWNCSDLLPGTAADELRGWWQADNPSSDAVPYFGTYAQAARYLRSTLTA